MFANSIGDLELFPADEWVISSLMQKAIRRGEAERAFRAAYTSYLSRGAACFHRLLTVAFEDVGMGDIDGVVDLTHWLSRSGSKGDKQTRARIAAVASSKLAGMPKDRSADFLLCAARRHPSFEDSRRSAKRMTFDVGRSIVADPSVSLVDRAITLLALSDALEEARRPRSADLLSALSILEPRVEAGLIKASATAIRKSGSLVGLMVPLLADSWSTKFELRDEHVDGSTFVGDIPMYALDKHTRLGRSAIRQFVRQNCEVRAELAKAVDGSSVVPAAMMAAYYMDAAPVSRRVIWVGSEELARLGFEADMYSAGVPIGAADAVLKTFTRHREELDVVRAAVFSQARRQGE